MKNLMVLLVFVFTSTVVKAQQLPKSGTYTYTISFIEGDGKPQGATCKVIIDGKKIKIVHDGNKNLSGKKGDLIAEGTIMRHIKSGKWIIGKTEDDIYALEIGGCSDGPIEVDFKHNVVYLC
jgi:hypothetical protein